MKIGIDVSPAVGDRTGVGQYSFNLVKELAKIDKENQYTIFSFFTYIYNEEFKKFDFNRDKNFKFKFENLSREWIDYLWRKLWIPKCKFLDGLDLFHSTTFCFPDDFSGKIISTIYDVSFKTHPQFHEQANIEHCERGVKQAIEKADKIIVISGHTKKDLIKYYNCPEEKIVITYLGCDERFRVLDGSEKISAIKKKYKIDKPFIFNVGSIEPRKNISGLMEAYSILENKYKKSFDLVIAGGKGWLNSGIYKKKEELNLAGNVKFIGYVDDDDLPYLYNSAELFVYPSFYEGFGLPILEAMACGCPVITSNSASMPEVSGDAAILIDPEKTDMLETAIESVLKNRGKHKSMKEKGLKQAEKFSWTKCAQETLRVYKDCLS